MTNKYVSSRVLNSAYLLLLLGSAEELLAS